MRRDHTVFLDLDEAFDQFALRCSVKAGKPGESGARNPIGFVAIESVRVREDRADCGAHRLFNALMLAPPLSSAAPSQADMPRLPSTPPMPFTYIGKQQSTGHWEVLLARGYDTLVVHNQTLVDGNYRVESIARPNLTLVYPPLHLVLRLDIGNAD